MSTNSCESFVLFIWEHLRWRFDRKTTVDLPYEIIADILSRLPAEAALLCEHACKPLGEAIRSPSFTNMHLSRATSVFAFNYFSSGINHSGRKISVYISDEVTQKILSKSITMELGSTDHKRTCMPTIYGSCNGFLLFRNRNFDVLLFIWNPVTQQHASVIAPHLGYYLCGFFFHKATQEYRVLYRSLDEVDFRYHILSLRTKSTRRIKSFTHPPCSLANPVMLNEVLYWMVCDASYKTAHGAYPPCLSSILSFDVNSEEFSVMPHPGRRCFFKNSFIRKHRAMKLTEMEGFLCLCDHSWHSEIVLWILEDAEEKIWVKRYVIFETYRLLSNVKPIWIQALHVFKDEILLHVQDKELFMYNMKRGTMRRVGEFCNQFVYAVRHVNTFATIDVDNIVYVSMDIARESRQNIEFFNSIMNE